MGVDLSLAGAVWFTDPARLLSVIRERLRPGGVLAFSQRPPVEGCYGCQARSCASTGSPERPRKCCPRQSAPGRSAPC
ncbi:hypothetical protein GCM10022420_004240 [Streptomyces iranensis]